MKKETNYASFSTSDFITDEFFQDWIFHPDKQNEAFWQNWIREHPDRKERLGKAKNILESLQFTEHFPSDEKAISALERNLLMLDKTKQRSVASVRRIRRRTWARAAVIAGIILLGYGGFRYWRGQERVTVSTHYAELKTVRLPDGSVITLNANSSISYPRFWNRKAKRRIWLKGEAFFAIRHINKDINHIKPEDRFIVHAGNLEVEVLGTTFDVKARDSLTSIMLKTGKVRLRFDKVARQDILLKPGDLVTYNTPRNKLTKTMTDTEAYTAWTERKYILKDASVKDIAAYIRDFYGYHIVWADTTIAHKTMEGTLLLDSLPDVLFVMSTALNIKIDQREDTLVFDKNTE